MTRRQTPAARVAVRSTAAAIALAALAAVQAHAAEIKASGRLMAGNIYRVQDRDPHLLTGVNAAAAGLSGDGAGGNADDANLNYARGDAASRAIRAVVELAAVQGNWSGLVRAKAWHDAGLARDGRPWGNVANSYAAGQPLSDSGAPRLSRFSGIALLDAWVQGKATLAGMPMLGRVGQQTLAWGERSMRPGGLEALNPRDMAGLHRAAPVAAETMLARPMLSTRPTGPALIPGDPDGRNMAYFTGYAEGLRITAATFSHKRAGGSMHGEVSYRPAVPFMLAPGDLLPPFMSATTPSLLRARADAVAPGGIFHGYDLYAVWQAQAGVRREWMLAGLGLAAGAEVVGKHTRGLPNPAILRYGRSDIFGVAAINGSCAVNTADAARQCSLRGYATPDAWGYRLRLDLRLPKLAPQLAGSASLLFVHDVKGWSGDLLLNEGRKSANLALRFEHRQRYPAELGYQPSWGGNYHAAADRDTASVAVGLKFRAAPGAGPLIRRGGVAVRPGRAAAPA